VRLSSSPYDAIFAELAPTIPVAFVRRLAYEESRLNPRSDDGGAKGILQITPIVVDDYQAARGLSPGVRIEKKRGYRWLDYSGLLEPRLNVKMANFTFDTIKRSYALHPWGGADWSSPLWVSLFVFGWNAGYSNGGGVGRAASRIEARGEVVTVDSVRAEAARSPGVIVEKLGTERAANWAKLVARRYFEDLGAPSSSAPSSSSSSSSSTPVKAGTYALLGLALFLAGEVL
jgi:hypothetical protein